MLNLDLHNDPDLCPSGNVTGPTFTYPGTTAPLLGGTPLDMHVGFLCQNNEAHVDFTLRTE